jgi:TATA-box binding protein (TBP) (component of TFIID and TFIIIB)
MRISTIVSVINLKTEININSIFSAFPITHEIIDIQPTRFSNQITIIVQLGKRFNVKVFSNGKIQITGMTKDYLNECKEIVGLLYKYGSKVDYIYTEACRIDNNGVIVTKTGNVLSKNAKESEYRTVGYIKDSVYFIGNKQFSSFKIQDTSLLMTTKHINKKKTVYSTNGTHIGEAEFFVLGNISKGKDITNRDLVFSLLSQNVDPSLPLEPETVYHTFRKTKNLILKNRCVSKYSDSVYIIHYSDKKEIISDIYTVKNVYGYIKFTWNSGENEWLSPINELETNTVLSIRCKTFQNLDFNNGPLDIHIANVNADMALPHTPGDTLNVNALNEILKNGAKNCSIDYRPAEYSASIVKFEYASIRIFKTFNCILTGNDIVKLQEYQNYLESITADNYRQVVYSKIAPDLSANLQKLSVHDII